MSFSDERLSRYFVVLACVASGASQLFLTRCSIADEPRPAAIDPLHGVDTLQGFDPLPSADPSGRQSAVASDLKPASAVDVAREVLRIQQQLGGSVVTDRPDLQGWNAPSPPAPVTSRQTGPASPQFPAHLPHQLPPQPTTQSSPPWSAYPPHKFRDSDLERSAISDHKVNELREAAWQLVSTAHGLEKLDLYDQADALRTVASQLRRDARRMKQQANLPAGEMSRFVPSELRTPKQRTSEPKP